MCGLLVQSGNLLSFDKFKNAVGLLIHRGPDFQASARVSPSVFMGHTRLSILDLNERSHQPMAFENLSLVFNGEIYNFHELRKDLQHRGYDFKTTSDTEVLLKMFHCYGPSFFSQLNGIFSFVIYDSSKNELIYGRDRYGVKPLYAHVTNESIILSSEIKPILYLKSECLSFRIESLEGLLQTNYPFESETPFKNISSVKPGIVYCKKVGQMSSVLYQKTIEDSLIEGQIENSQSDEASLQIKFEALLEGSVRRQLISDVPVGIFLSGGLDSGVLAHYVKKHATYQVSSYSYSNLNDPDDESQLAASFAAELGFDHQNITIDLKKDFDRLYGKCLYYSEFPIPYPAALPLYALSEEAHRKNKVVLTGDGGDELLGGYNKYIIGQKESNRWKNKFLASVKGKRKAYNELSRQLSRYFQNPNDYIVFRWGDKKINGAELSQFEDVQCEPVGFLNHFLIFDQKNFLQGMLHKTDSMTMAHSLEGRVPYLDNQFAELCNRMSSEYKIHEGEKKYILKNLAAKVLPKSYLSAPKRGFPVKIIENKMWSEADGIIDRFVSHEIIRERIRKNTADQLKQMAASRTMDYMTLWFMFTFVDWYAMYFNEKSFTRNASGDTVKEQINTIL